MIQQREMGWNALFGASVLGIGAAIWYGFLLPMPAPAPVSSLSEIKATTQKATDKAKIAQKSIDAQTWDLGLEALASQTLDRLTTLAGKQGVQLSNFRTEKGQEKGGLVEVPFVVVVDGTFTNVVAFVQRLEQPDSKLAVELFQVNSSEAAPGRVTATLGLAGFLKPKEVKKDG